MTTAHGICKKCGKEAVHLAMSGIIDFQGDQDDDLGNESIYADEVIFPDEVSVGIHVCFECGAVEDVWIEHPHENKTIDQLRTENARLAVENDDLMGKILNEIDENARLTAELAAARDELAETEYFMGQTVAQADAFHSENAKLREMVRKLNITTVARRYTHGDMECDNDGSGPARCDNDVVWEIQAMDDSGSHYAYVCDAHLGDYQKWAHDDGRLPMVFELDDSE